MFILPLGLGSRLPSAPLMCGLLCLCIVGYSAVSFKVVRKFDDQMKGANLDKFRIVSGAFFKELCELRVKDAKQCAEMSARLAKRIKTEDDEDTKDNSRTKSAPSAPTKDIKSTLSSALGVMKTAEEFADIIRDPLKVKDPSVRALPSYKPLMQFHVDRQARTDMLAKQLGLLNKHTLGFITLLKAQFSHAGWMHLLSNLLVLVLVGVYLEARVGALWFLAMFLVSGMLGMCIHLLMSTDPTKVVLGASAGVAGVMGAFLAYFFYQPMKVWLSYLLVFNRVIFIPSFLVLGLMFIVHDVIGAISTTDGVAHVAHLGGLLIGFALGTAQKKLSPVSAGMLYSDEEFFTRRLNDIPNTEKRVEMARRILTWNHNNLAALRILILSLADLPFEHEPQELSEPLTGYLAICLREKRKNPALEIVQSLPARVPLASQITRLNLKNRLQLAEHALSKGDWITAIRVYDTALVKSMKTETREKILQSVEQLYKHVNPDGPAPERLRQLRLSSELKEKFAA
jgi:membrane associated rhomboid family serine protease